MHTDESTLEPSGSTAGATRSSRGEAWLCVAHSPAGLRGQIIHPRESPRLGRSVAGLDDPRMSKTHVELTRASGHLRASDLNSRNGTWLNGHRLRPGTVAPLADGDLLRVGDTLLVVRYGEPIEVPFDDPFLPGRAPEVATLRETARRYAGLDLPILLLGETGTGKERCARALHEARSPRAPFIAINCGELNRAISRAELFGTVEGAFTGARASGGLVGESGGGTLFLDEIGDLPLNVQVELVRLLEERTYRAVGATKERSFDARVLAATHVELDDAMAAGRFRRDLLARLRGYLPPLVLPPMRARREDLPEWFERFSRLAGETTGLPLGRISAGCAEAVILHHWPENLRGLRQAATAALLAAGGGRELKATHLPPAAAASRQRARHTEALALPKSSGDTPDRPTLEAALSASGGVVRVAAESLGLERSRFYRLCRSLGVDVGAFRG